MTFRAQEVDDVPQGGHFTIALGLLVLLDDTVHGDSEQFVIRKGQVEAGLQAMEGRHRCCPVIGDTVLDAGVLQRSTQIGLHLLIGVRVLRFDQGAMTKDIHRQMRATHLTHLFELLELHLGLRRELGLIIAQEDETGEECDVSCRHLLTR